MARITRSSIISNQVYLLGLQNGVDQVASYTADRVVPIVEIGIRHTEFLKSLERSTTGSGTVYTTPTDKDFFLTYIMVSWDKNAACDCTIITVNGTSMGASLRLLSIPVITLTAQTDTVMITFPYPIKIDRNTTITTGGSFTAGTLTRYVTIGGFVLE